MGGLHVGVGVVHDEAVTRDIRADVLADFAMMEAVEVDALPVDDGEGIARVVGAVYVACRVDGDGFSIDGLRGVPDAGSGVSFDADFGGVSGLQCVAPDGVE